MLPLLLLLRADCVLCDLQNIHAHKIAQEVKRNEDEMDHVNRIVMICVTCHRHSTQQTNKQTIKQADTTEYIRT